MRIASSKAVPGGILAILAIAGVLAWLIWMGRTIKGRRASSPQAVGTNEVTNAATVRPDATTSAGSNDSLSTAVGALGRSTNQSDSRQILSELRKYLASLSPDDASRAIQTMLDSKVDAPTQLGFTVGSGGFLKEAPSLRVFLLDYLAQVDPAGAANYAEKILADMNSPDEWAVALRNYATGRDTLTGRANLEDKMRALLGHEQWQREASAGFLEAFDVAVWLGGTNLMPSLTTLVRQQDNRAVAHAAFLALDRLTLADPSSTLAALLANPDSMNGREQTRANYFARANVEDPRQREILESYLVDPQRAPAELRTFAGLFPSGNFMVSDNLLTRTATPAGATLARQDRSALQVVDGWMSDPRFERLKLHLQEIRIRLQKFQEQSQAGK